MNWSLLLNVIVVLEVIGVEFTSIWFLSQKKHSFAASLGLYMAVTAPLILFMCLVATRLPGYGNGSGGFMLLGAFYFIPAMINYGGDWKSRIIIAFYSFSYGLGGFALAIRISYLFGEENLSLSTFVALPMLYAISLPIFLRFSRRRVIPYIQKAGQRQKNMLIRHTIASFLLVISYNNIMVADASVYKKLLLYMLLLYFIILTYRLVVSYLQAADDKQELNALARTDRLTGLGNRLALRDEADVLLQKGAPFSLLFMDLDRFKTVNDRFGHSAGDVYLCQFAKALQGLAGKDSSFFRLSGDEFVCLSQDDRMYQALLLLTLPGIENGPEFLGLSVGSARFPEEAQTIADLMELADHRMYEQKTGKPGR